MAIWVLLLAVLALGFPARWALIGAAYLYTIDHR